MDPPPDAVDRAAHKRRGRRLWLTTSSSALGRVARFVSTLPPVWLRTARALQNYSGRRGSDSKKVGSTFSLNKWPAWAVCSLPAPRVGWKKKTQCFPAVAGGAVLSLLKGFVHGFHAMNLAKKKRRLFKALSKTAPPFLSVRLVLNPILKDISIACGPSSFWMALRPERLTGDATNPFFTGWAGPRLASSLAGPSLFSLAITSSQKPCCRGGNARAPGVSKQLTLVHQQKLIPFTASLLYNLANLKISQRPSKGHFWKEWQSQVKSKS